MDLGPRGQRLWDALATRNFDLTDERNPFREIAVSACRAADVVEALELKCLTAEPVVQRKSGPVIHPAWAETRQQTHALTVLLAALRLPDAQGRRPIKRPLRGAHRMTTATK